MVVNSIIKKKHNKIQIWMVDAHSVLIIVSATSSASILVSLLNFWAVVFSTLFFSSVIPKSPFTINDL